MRYPFHRQSLLAALIVVNFSAGCSAAGTDTAQAASEVNVSQGEQGPYVSEGLARAGLKDPAVRAAMSRVPRHRFMPEDVQEEAYSDRAVSIGKGQTISQPYIVALMSENANISWGSKVLEVGTGSGYQAAVLAELGARVFSIEIIPDLARKAKETLSELGYTDRVSLREGDGWEGWIEEAPYDAILVTAASPRIPPKLLSQLANRGRMVIPIEGEGKKGERLLVIERQDDNYITRNLGAVRFVPLTGTARETPVPESESATAEALGIGAAPKSPENATPVSSGTGGSTRPRNQ